MSGDYQLKAVLEKIQRSTFVVSGPSGLLDANQKGWSILETLSEVLEHEHVFEHKRKSSTAIALAVYSYYFDLSLLRTSQMMSILVPTSHESVRN